MEVYNGKSEFNYLYPKWSGCLYNPTCRKIQTKKKAQGTGGGTTQADRTITKRKSSKINNNY